MRARPLLAAAIVPCLVMLAACTTFEARLDPTLFGVPTAAAADPSPGAVLLRMPADGSNLVVTVGGLRGFDANRVRLPAGEIVRAAAQAAFAREFSGGVQFETADQRSLPRSNDAPWQVIVALDAIHFDFRDDFIYLIPLGPLTIERRDVTVRMALTVSVVDEGGAVRWSRSYDAGRELWKARGGALFPSESPAEGVQRLAHQQTWRLMTRAAQDVRRFTETDRRRERVL